MGAAPLDEGPQVTLLYVASFPKVTSRSKAAAPASRHIPGHRMEEVAGAVGGGVQIIE